MGWTDRHFRYLLRLIGTEAWLYSEMFPVQTLVRGADPSKRIDFHPAEHPIALQLGGDDPVPVSQAAYLGWKAGYDEINLNVGCPSPKVLKGGFGVCLMENPGWVGAMVSAIRDAVPIPVTIKCRLGFDHHLEPSFLESFVRAVAEQGCNTFFVHARMAWLDGVSPKANRSLPPLDYDSVIRLKQKYPGLEIVLNGGIRSSSQVHDLLGQVDGVMVGRKILDDPLWLAALEAAAGLRRSPVPSRLKVIQGYGAYLSRVFQSPTDGHESRQRLFQPLLTVMRGFSGAARLRRLVCEAGRASETGGGGWIEHILGELASIAPEAGGSAMGSLSQADPSRSRPVPAGCGSTPL